MLTVEIKLHSAVTGKVTTLASGKIVNTGTGSPTQGNYIAVLRDASGREWRRVELTRFPRKRLLAWDLLYRALQKAVGDRNPTPKTAASVDFIVGSKDATPNNEANDDRPVTKPDCDSP
ncbi:MAG: hypothetical protein ABFC88_12490 [Thermoguttaceae bacterium]